jgi:hypothetical protein
MATEARLNEIDGPSRLGKGFFNKLIRRIECTKPIAGANVTLIDVPDGIQISVTGVVTAGGGGLNQITLNVCSNGTPSTIIVYGPGAATTTT